MDGNNNNNSDDDDAAARGKPENDARRMGVPVGGGNESGRGSLTLIIWAPENPSSWLVINDRRRIFLVRALL